MAARTFKRSTLNGFKPTRLYQTAQFHNNRLGLGENLAGKGKQYLVEFILENQ